jgi:hypothetical protein
MVYFQSIEQLQKLQNPQNCQTPFSAHDEEYSFSDA